MRHATLQNIDAGWDTDEAESPSRPALSVMDGGANPDSPAPALRVVRAEPGRSEGKPPLPGLPPLPDPRQVLASRVLMRAEAGSMAAQMATAIVRRAPTQSDEEPPAAPPRRRAGALPCPARSRVALASMRRHGAIRHIGPARRPTHARMIELRQPEPQPAAAAEISPEPARSGKRSIWSRLFG